MIIGVTKDLRSVKRICEKFKPHHKLVINSFNEKKFNDISKKSDFTKGVFT